jgi:peptidoglycan/xylan/chitin deacetylase (PgdA/CDA1 family)
MLALCLALCALEPMSPARASSYSDVGDIAAARAIEKLSSWGILKGYEGRFRPNEPITRAEMAAILNRLAGYILTGNGKLGDIASDAWYYGDVMRVFAAGIMQGDGVLFRPNDYITRQEAVTTVSRAFGIADSVAEPEPLSDESGIADWALGHIRAMSARGYLAGLGDDILPGQDITRAETAMILGEMFDVFLDKPGSYSELSGNVLVRCADVMLKDCRLDRLYIMDGVGSGWYTLNNTTVSASTLQRAGKLNPYPHIDTSKPMVALTFDDGPGAGTSGVLDVLEKYKARATFCVVGYMVQASPEQVKRAVSLGSEIASHTWNHSDIRYMSASSLLSDVTRVSDAIEAAAGVRPVFLRPPYGNRNSSTDATLGSAGMSVLWWSVDTEDWKTRSSYTTYSRVIAGAKDGAIILMHDSQGSTASAMELAVPELINRGIQLVTVSEMLTYSKPGIKPGAVYYSRDRVG